MQAEGQPAGSLECWTGVLEEMEHFLRGVRSALEHGAAIPAVTVPPLPEVPLPEELAPRARILHAAQHDLEVALRERVGILGAAMRRDPLARRAAISLYLDRSA